MEILRSTIFLHRSFENFNCFFKCSFLSPTLTSPKLLWRCLLLDRVENIVGKGENAGYQHFLLFPQCFQKSRRNQILYGIELKLSPPYRFKSILEKIAFDVVKQEKMMVTSIISSFHNVFYPIEDKFHPLSHV